MLIQPASLSFPTPPDRLFGRGGPLALEIGFGGGHFLTWLAQAHPHWNVLAAEISLGSISRAYRRLRRAGIANVRLYRGDGCLLVQEVIPPRRLHRVYVNFPDPWPKEKHHHKRLLQQNFFRLLSTRLDDGGALFLTTDHQAYFQHAQEAARATGLFDVEEAAPPAAALKTKYARKWQAQQKPIFHAVFSKTAEADEPFEPRLQQTAMHHAILEGDLPALDTFEKQVHPIDGGQVLLLKAYRALDEPGYVILGLVEEHDLRQDVLIEVRPSPKGIFVGVARFGNPLITKGTSAAVRLVTEWLERQGLETIEALY